MLLFKAFTSHFNVPLKTRPGALFLVWLLSLSYATASEEAPKVYLSSSLDLGHVYEGKQAGQEVERLPLNRNTVKMGVGQYWSSDWELKGVFKNIIWWPFGGNSTQPFERVVRVEPSLEDVSATRHFDNGFFRFGFFPYKYNQNAMDLGEYLHRSGTYPGYLISNYNWELMNGATHYFYGGLFRYTHLEGMLTHNISLSFESEINPIGDITPAYDFNLKTGPLEIGGGIAFNHLISFRPSRLAPKDPTNAWVSFDTTVVIQPADSIQAADTTVIPAYTGFLSQAGVSVRRPIIQDEIFTPEAEYITHRGIKLMGMASLNLGFLIPEEYRNPRDLTLFMEMAVLGLENQASYYEKRSQRIPVMFGINIPSFKLLDVLCFQMEYYGTPYDNFGNYNQKSLPQWTYSNQPNYRDDWKWAAYLSKTFNPLFKFHFLVANDHLRALAFDVIKTDIALTQNPSHWYYLAKFEFGIF